MKHPVQLLKSPLLIVCAAVPCIALVGWSDEPEKVSAQVATVVNEASPQLDKPSLNSSEEAYIRTLALTSDLIDSSVIDFERDGNIPLAANKINEAAVLYARQQGIELYQSGIRINLAQVPAKLVPPRFLSTHTYYSKGLQSLIQTFYLLYNSPQPVIPSTDRNSRVESGLDIIDRAWEEVATAAAIVRTPRPRLIVAKEVPTEVPLSVVPKPLEIPRRARPKLPVTFDQQVRNSMNQINRANSSKELIRLSNAWSLSSRNPRLSPFQQGLFQAHAAWARDKIRFLNGQISPLQYRLLKEGYVGRIGVIKQNIKTYD